MEVLVFTGHEVRTYPVPVTGCLSIGRAEENDIRIDHASVSRQHALLHAGPPMRIEDLGGCNGTFLQARSASAIGLDTQSTTPVHRGSAPVGPGDTLKIGIATLEVRPVLAPPDRPAEVPPSPAMRAVLEHARLAAESQISVLILGETGVGKEVLARTIHRLSPRAAGTFLALNCAALSESLLESELFGHEKGAFTGALQARPGLFEAAEGGTLFLDEVGELPMNIQVKLLRVLEERQVLRVGARTARPVDVRFVSATNRDLAAEVARGAFRQDLYYRLDGISLTIPPLRRRTDEIGPLAASFAAEICRRMERRVTPALSGEALSMLERHAWPGNIRELRNAVERAVVLCRGDRLSPEHFPAQLAARPSAPEPPPKDDAMDRLEHEMEEADRKRVIRALEQCQGNQTKAAAMLGMSRTTLVARLEAYGLPRPRKKG